MCRAKDMVIVTEFENLPLYHPTTRVLRGVGLVHTKGNGVCLDLSPNTQREKDYLVNRLNG